MKFILITILLFATMKTKSKDLKFFYNEKDYITYEKHGTGNISLIYLHGFGASKNSWYDFYNLFDSLRYTSYLIDLKGFGNSSIPKDNKYSLIDNAIIVTEFINHEIKSDYIIIGHSFGGGVALLQNITTALISKPSCQILLDCAAYNLDTPFFIKYLKTPVVNRLMFILSSANYRAKFSIKRIVLKENLSDTIISRYAKSFKGKRKSYSFIHSAKQLIPKDYNKLIEKYDEIKVPTLIIWGSEDEILSPTQGKLLHKQILNSQLEIIEKCGHIPHEEHPVKVFEIVNKYIKFLGL